MTSTPPSWALFAALVLAFSLGGDKARAEDRLPHSVLVSVQVDYGYQGSAPMQQVYADAGPFGVGMRGTYLYGERFGLGLGASVQGREGTGVAASGEGAPTILWQVPIFFEGILRMSFKRSQIPVPYLRGGLTAVAWSETDGVTDPTGLKWGPHAGGGVQFQLPFPEINWEGRMTGNPYLSDIYLHVEGWARAANNFGAPGLDLSAVGFGVGLGLLL